MIDFTTILTDLEGSSIMDNGRLVTLGRAAMMALIGQVPEDQSMTGEDRFRFARLAEKVMDNPAAKLPVEDVALIKDRIGKFFSPVVVYRAWPLLDPAVA